MPATRSKILSWLAKGQEQGATHVVIRCDTYEYRGSPGDGCCYPVYVTPDESVDEQARSGGDRLMEVYSLTGKHTVESQMQEHRAFHYD